ncbi:MAG: PAP/fibrillin family protein [Pseudomonadota bacterium]
MMADIAAIKSQLNAAIDACKPDGTYDDATFDKVHELVNELVPLNPTPSPLANQSFIEAPWGSRFAQFGPKHTAGKPIQHETTMALQTFGQFPKVPILVHDIDQEIRVDGNHYNNVTDISTPDGKHKATLIVWGRYEVGEDNPVRYGVDFYMIELRAPDGVSDEELRAQFGLEEGLELKREMKPPKLHSDIVYCDDDMRINFGSMGGVYVMKRLDTPGKSVAFA